MTQHWGMRLRHALRSRRVRKLHALAVEIGVDQSAISRWRKGRPISLPNAISLCEALGISLDWLLMGRGTMEERSIASADPVEQAARAFFGNLTAQEAAVVRRVLVVLSDAASRRAETS